MALTLATLHMASVGNPALPKLWTYTTEDDITDLDAANYWAGAYARAMRANDKIFAACADGYVEIVVSAIDATTSTAAAQSTTAQDIVAEAPVWVGPIACDGLETAGTVGTAIAPIAGTITKWKWITDEVTDVADAILNIDIGGTNATGSITVDKDDSVNQVEEADVTADGTVTEGALILIETNGGATSTGAGRVWVLIEP